MKGTSMKGSIRPWAGMGNLNLCWQGTFPVNENTEEANQLISIYNFLRNSPVTLFPPVQEGKLTNQQAAHKGGTHGNMGARSRTYPKNFLITPRGMNKTSTDLVPEMLVLVSEVRFQPRQVIYYYAADECMEPSTDTLVVWFLLNRIKTLWFYVHTHWVLPGENIVSVPVDYPISTSNQLISFLPIVTQGFKKFNYLGHEHGLKDVKDGSVILGISVDEVESLFREQMQLSA